MKRLCKWVVLSSCILLMLNSCTDEYKEVEASITDVPSLTDPTLEDEEIDEPTGQPK